MISPGIRTAAATCLSAVALMLCPPGTVTVAGADKDENEAEGSVVDASAMLEIYETDSAQAESLLKSRLDASALIERLESLAADEKAHLVDCLFGRVAADHKAEYQSVEEVIVGLYGDPPEIPNKITIKGPVQGVIRPSSSVFMTFDKRDVGISWALALTTAHATISTRVRPRPEPGVWVDRRSGRNGRTRHSADPSHAIALTFDWTVLAGHDSPYVRPGVTPKDHPQAAKSQPRFRRVKPEGLIFPLLNGEPMLITCVPSPRTPDKHAFVFLTAWRLPVVEAKPAAP